MDYMEVCFSKLLMSVRAHEAKRFVKALAFAEFASPTIEVTSPDLGPSGAQMSIDYTQEGKDLFPALTWNAIPGTKQHFVCVQDVDAPIWVPLTHGIFYSIPGEKTEVLDVDFDPREGSRKSPKKGVELKGGFKYGANFKRTVYDGPRALKGHGPHCYYFQVMALKEELELEKLGPVASVNQLAKEIEGKVLGWGEWIGLSERKF
jgi:phosphatidylethanolamine-binding protein (PEBP) family uncharacterized protein